MYLLRQIYNKRERLDDFHIYQFINNNWQLDETIKVKHQKYLFELMQGKHIKLDYAIIKLNQPYRNILYHLYPQIKIIIDRHEITALFSTIMREEPDAYEEAAASIEHRYHTDYFKGDIRYFVYDFYHMKSKAEATAFYELWQNYIPINDKRIGRLVRVMEFYFDEIINYFDVNRGIIRLFTEETE